MFVTYKTTCVITGKFYIGSHKTEDINDGYLGSGRLLRKSIEEYGEENHIKEILGVFDNREDSLCLEHTLVKLYKKQNKNLSLNGTNGGWSFDYINNNLKFDRAAFGRMASHAHMLYLRKKHIEEYNKNPKLCVFCKKPMPYDKRYNKFCNQHCSASYNNSNRELTKTNRILIKCKYCHKDMYVSKGSTKKFCSVQCVGAYKKEHRPLNCKRNTILKDLPIIIERHKTESYRKIAEDYNVSGNYIKEAILGRLH